MFLIDLSASHAFGSTTRSKLGLVVEIAALLMFSALKNNDKVGLITFCDQVVEHLPPRKGKSHVLRTIRTLVSAPPLARTTRLTSALEFLNRVQKRRAVVFVISDFLTEDAARVLAVTNQRHDLTAIHVGDPREWQIPDIGLACFRDAETGELVEVDLRDRRVRQQLADLAAARRERLSRQFRRLGIDELAVDTETDYTHSLRRFFQMRQQRFR
jgi:uncharacterized protein (DUF58 family)